MHVMTFTNLFTTSLHNFSAILQNMRCKIFKDLKCLLSARTTAIIMINSKYNFLFL